MGGPIELVPLVCIRCSTPIPAEVDEVAWVCAQCGQGMALDEEKGLCPLDIHFVPGIQPAKPGKPFWVVDGQVAMQRDTYKGNENSQSQYFWSQPRRFFVPAFSCSLEDLLSTGTRLLVQPPALQDGPRGSFERVVLHSDDIRAAVEFIIMAVEAERKDWLKEVRFNLNLSQPALWILP